MISLVRRSIESLRLALGCLTIVPVGPREAVRDRAFGASWVWFPLVGCGIGAILLAVYTVLWRWATPMVAAIGVLVTWVAVTGALHLDGLADVCDGWYGGRTPQERLRIMKDPHIGAMAAIGISLHLLVKFVALAHLPSAHAAVLLLLAPALGRYAMALLGSTLPYARAEGGVGAAFVRQAGRRSLIGATLMMLGLSLVIGSIIGVALLGLTLAVGLILRAVFRRTLGGITGDALGAAGELTEVALLIGGGSLVAVLHA